VSLPPWPTGREPGLSAFQLARVPLRIPRSLRSPVRSRSRALGRWESAAHRPPLGGHQRATIRRRQTGSCELITWMVVRPRPGSRRVFAPRTRRWRGALPCRGRSRGLSPSNPLQARRDDPPEPGNRYREGVESRFALHGRTRGKRAHDRPVSPCILAVSESAWRPLLEGVRYPHGVTGSARGDSPTRLPPVIIRRREQAEKEGM